MSKCVRVIAAKSMRELYAEHDIFVFPSLMEGRPDVMQDSVNGLVVPPADAAALESTIVRLAESVARTAQEARKQDQWSSATQKLEQLFGEDCAAGRFKA
jgi:glycosyltransferase involved in cell wall biosynthesis